MTSSTFHSRFVRDRLAEALADSPAVLIHGPRQCGKTTLARSVCEPLGYGYYSFDDDATREAARDDPAGFVATLPPRTILDEAQRAPEIFATLKMAIDRDRVPGRFVLTGSANVLLVPRLSDSLAGRMAILRLHPLSQAELAGKKPRFLETLFTGRFPFGRSEMLGAGLAERIAAGGYPAAVARKDPKRRAAWYREYSETLIQRDIRDLARIGALEAIPRLLEAVAVQTANLVNFSDLAAPFELTRQTIHEYVVLLERIFVLDRLRPWHSNRLKRLIKTPKIHLGDTGIACALLALDAPALLADRPALGTLLETFVFQELRRQASWFEDAITFQHFRDKDGVEVDIVLEIGARKVAGVEVKAGATVRSGDFNGLRKLKEATGSKFAAGIVLYDGEMTVGFGEGMQAVPIRALWETV